MSKTKIITDEVNFARDLTNLPANELNPSIFAKEAKRKAKELNLQCEILEKKIWKNLGLVHYLQLRKVVVRSQSL